MLLLSLQGLYQQQRFKLFYCYAICYLFLPLVLSFLIMYNISEGSIAQLVERLPYKQDVIGSIPVGSKKTKTSNKRPLTFLTFLFTKHFIKVFISFAKKIKHFKLSTGIGFSGIKTH